MSKNKPSLKEKEAMNEDTISGGIESFDDQLAISPNLIKEIEEQGLVYRWINAHTFQRNHGFDSRQWAPYKMKNPINIGGLIAKDSEGYIRRGDLILAVQTEAVASRRKARMDMRRQALNAAVQNKEAASQLKKSMRDAGIQAKVHEGYDENGDE